jgi:hypothetical protein
MRRLLSLLVLLPALAFGQTTVKVYTTDTVTSAASLNQLNATAVVPMAGKTTAGFIVTGTSSPTGMILVNESSRDGTNWDPHPFLDVSTGERISAVPNASLVTGYGRTLLTGGGDRYVRVRVADWTSGSVTVSVTATDTIVPVAWPVDMLVTSQAVSTATSLTQLVTNPITTCTDVATPYSCCTGNGAGATCAIYVTSIIASSSAASSTAADSHFTLKYGTASNCGTGTTTLMPLAMNVANGGFVWSLPPGFAIKVPAANGLCWIHSVAGSKIINVGYFIGG